MPDYIKFLTDDLIEQFRQKELISGLVEAVGAQLNEISAFFGQLDEARDVHSAIGKQLDGIGDIAVLSRMDAWKIGKRMVDDELYRKYLIFQIFKNSSDATYSDTLRSIEMFWDGPPMRYSEDPAIPAVMLFEFEADDNSPTEQLERMPLIKSAGVGLRIRGRYSRDSIISIGTAASHLITADIPGEAVRLDGVFLADEHGSLLTDETDSLLTE